jgi:hypothetical protein
MTSKSKLNISRRQLVALGAAGAAGGLAGKASVGDTAAAGARLGGVHIDVTVRVVQPEPPNERFIHTFIVTLWGPDDALSGMGSGYTEGDASQNLVGTGYVGCVFGAHAKIEGDVIRGSGVMMYSGDPEEKRGQPFPFEANLATGFCRFTDMNFGMGPALPAGPSAGPVVTEGTGTVTRI